MDLETIEIFLRRRSREVQEVIVIVLVLSFLGLYRVSGFVRKGVDAVVEPAVAGMTVAYGKLSTFLNRTTGFNLGFVSIPPDRDFIFRVQVATYVNERQASPLLDMAVDTRLPAPKREEALRALLRFDSVEDWVQPFLNELPKGGLLSHFDENSPVLDDLMKRIRSEGGVRQALVRAYAEVVFGFLLQVPDAKIRRRSLEWLSDVLAEDAIFLLVPRIALEKDPEIRRQIDQALWNIRAVSDPGRAISQLLPYYKKPPWPSLRVPLAMVMSRLGLEGAPVYLERLVADTHLEGEKKVAVQLAAARRAFPKELVVTEVDRQALAQRRHARQQQYAAAVEKQKRQARQKRVKQTLLAKAQGKSTPPVTAAPAVREKPLPPPVPVAEKPEKAAAPPAKPAPPPAKPIPQAPVPVDEPVEATLPEEHVEEPVVASLPEEPEPEPVPAFEPPPAKPSSNMRYVDKIFEVKEQEVPLYQSPGDLSPSGEKLPVGSKGKASFEVMIGEQAWYQVKSKNASGWVQGAMVKLYTLSPEPASEKAQATAPEKSMRTEKRRESTYFEPNMANVPVYREPSDRSPSVATLVEGQSYLAIESQKIKSDRWFLLKIKPDLSGWVRGIDVQLADVVETVDESAALPENPLASSAFRPDWVVAGVNGVGVYSRPSLASKMIRKISPPEIYAVVDTGEGGGSEWYKIKVGDKQEGWVQTLDVSLTKPN